MKSDIILALDPGLRDLGYAVLSGRRLLACGVRTLRSLPAGDRLRAARESLRAWVRGYRPSSIVWEAAPKHSVLGHARVHRFIRSAARMAEARGICSAAYSAKTVRQNVVGDGWATKAEVASALSTRFPELRVYLGHSRKWKERYWHNLFDAIAVALHHQAITKKPPSRSRRCG
jgi:Holliday junction resolvasome RuvABC endonuclease subunit